MAADYPIYTAAAVGTIVAGSSFYLIRQYTQGGRCYSKTRLDGQTVIVTGGNSGLGVETAKDMAKRGARVIITSRDIKQGEDVAKLIRDQTGNGNVVVYKLDLASLEAIRQFAEKVNKDEERLDILINNAGVMLCPKEMKTKDGFDLQMGTNHLGHFLLTNLLLDKLKQSPAGRVVTVSSTAHKRGKIEMEDINKVDGYNTMDLYGRSKLANIMFTYHLNKLLKGTNVTCYSLHPGVIFTSLTRHSFMARVLMTATHRLFFKTIEQGAQTTIYCAVQEGIEHQSGKYFSDCAEGKLLHASAYNDKECEELWKVSSQLVSLK